MGFIRDQLRRHLRFYSAALIGIVVWLASAPLVPSLRYAVAGDSFFASYLVLIFMMAAQTTPKHLEELSKAEDEGITLITLITFAAVGFSLSAIFGLLNQGGKPAGLALALTIGSAPLGWFMLNAVAAFHYAHRYYLAGHGGLAFPETPSPGLWDFLYYSFVVGMTAQVSDVQVTSSAMRRLTLAHGIASFFYNTVLIALSVNVVVVLATP
jgi:uncharacterized membrane protein